MYIRSVLPGLKVKFNHVFGVEIVGVAIQFKDQNTLFSLIFIQL